MNLFWSIFLIFTVLQAPPFRKNVFFPAFQGSGGPYPPPFLRNGSAALPIGARLVRAKALTVVFLSLRVYNHAMDLIEKFSSDVEKIKKHYRTEHQTYNGEEVCNQVAAFFEQQNRDVASLAHSYAGYWKEAYILPSQNMEEEPTQEHIEILAGMLALLLDVEDSYEFTECFSQEDWKQLCQLTNYEAEDLPLELLSSLMKNFVDNQAV